jgi:hypothetical protein
MQKMAMYLDVNLNCVFGLYCFCEVFGLIHALANCNALIIIIIILKKITDIFNLLFCYIDTENIIFVSNS